MIERSAGPRFSPLAGAPQEATDLNALARDATAGDRRALERLCESIQDLVYRLALRFFSDPDDAADATQEILIQVVTHLGGFEGRSRFTTWVYTIASRHLARTKTRRIESMVAGAVPFAEWLDTHIAPESYRADTEAEYRMLCEEVRISCTYGMLLTSRATCGSPTSSATSSRCRTARARRRSRSRPRHSGSASSAPARPCVRSSQDAARWS